MSIPPAVSGVNDGICVLALMMREEFFMIPNYHISTVGFWFFLSTAPLKLDYVYIFSPCLKPPPNALFVLSMTLA